MMKIKAEHPFVSRKLKGKITPELLYKTIMKHADKDAVVVTDVGQHQIWTAQFYNVDQPRHFLSSGGLGTMGFGLPASMGAKLGCPDKQVILFTGDGSIHRKRSGRFSGHGPGHGSGRHEGQRSQKAGQRCESGAGEQGVRAG